MKKLFLCVGAAKTGTTWLYRNLQHNPGLWFTPEKELNFFFSRHGWFDRLTTQHRTEKRERFERLGRRKPASFFEGRLAWYRKYESGDVTPDWYRSLFDGMPDDAWACDFSPSTSLISPQGWTEVSQFAPEIRIVYIMREPLARLWSHAKFHATYTGKLDDFRTMSLREMNRFIDRANLTVDGDYGTHLNGIYKKIPREKVLVIDYARISAKPGAVLREVEAFLGLEETPPLPIGAKERINTSEKLPRPEGFGDVYRDRFRRESAMVARNGHDFAAAWRDMHARPFYWARDLIRPLRRK